MKQQQQQQTEEQTQAQVKQEEELPVEKEVKQEDEKPCSEPNELPEKDVQPLDSASCPLMEPPNPPEDLSSLCRTPDSSMTTDATATTSASSPTHSTSKPTVLCSTPADSVPLVAQFGASPSQFGIPLSLQHHQHLLANDQLLRVLTERSGHWFSLLPRSPCDESSLIQPTMPLRSSAQPNSVQPRSPPTLSCSPHQHLQPPSASSSPLNATHDGLGNLTVSPLQVIFHSYLLIVIEYALYFTSSLTKQINDLQRHFSYLVCPALLHICTHLSCYHTHVLHSGTLILEFSPVSTLWSPLSQCTTMRKQPLALLFFRSETDFNVTQAFFCI